jgi:hypothetical protein
MSLRALPISGTVQIRMRSLSRLSQVLAIVICAMPALPVAMATLMRTMDLAELTASSDQIVVGDVVSQESAWDSQHRNIYTTIEISIRESWKGGTPADGRIRIRQLGGMVGDIEMSVHGMPRFAPGERSLLFLRQTQVVGWSQGKRRVHWDSTGNRWLADAPDRSGISLDAQARPESNQPEALDRLRERIRVLIGK